MTATPSEPAPYQQNLADGPQSVRPRRGWTVIVWLLLLALVLVIAFIEHILPVPTEDLSPQFMSPSSMNLQLIGQYAIAADRFLFSDADAKELIGQIEQIAVYPKDRLRAIPIYAELLDTQSALEQLDGLIESNTLDPALLDDAAILRKIYTKDGAAVDDQDKEQLLYRHGWFGELAISFDRPNQDPVRRRAMQPVGSILWKIIAGLLLLLTIGLAGVTLFIVVLVMLCLGKIRLRYAHGDLRSPEGRPVCLESFVIYLAAMLFIALLGALTNHLMGVDVKWFLLVLVFCVPLWPMLRGMPWPDLCVSLGWHRGRGLWREIGAGLLGYVAGMPILWVGLLITIILAQVTHIEPSHPLVLDLADAGVVKIVGLYLLVGVWAPVVEESMFRGALFHHLRGRLNAVTSSLLVGFIFAAIHPQGIVAVPVLGAVGFLFALIREWRGSIIGPIFAHAVHNCVAITVFLLVWHELMT